MFDEFKTWVESIIGSGYVYSMGMWTDRSGISTSSICAIQQTGGPNPDVDDRRRRFKVILLGPVNSRQSAGAIKLAADSLADASLALPAPCGAARIGMIGEPVGPGYTTENRAWFSMEFEVLF